MYEFTWFNSPLIWLKFDWNCVPNWHSDSNSGCHTSDKILSCCFERWYLPIQDSTINFTTTSSFIQSLHRFQCVVSNEVSNGNCDIDSCSELCGCYSKHKFETTKPEWRKRLKPKNNMALDSCNFVSGLQSYIGGLRKLYNLENQLDYTGHKLDNSGNQLDCSKLQLDCTGS